MWYFIGLFLVTAWVNSYKNHITNQYSIGFTNHFPTIKNLQQKSDTDIRRRKAVVENILTSWSETWMDGIDFRKKAQKSRDILPINNKLQLWQKLKFDFGLDFGGISVR